jgi:phosphoribosylaminoimidazole-succinocarboxamide synthase
MVMSVIESTTVIDAVFLGRGKVRDLYALGDEGEEDRLLIVATDRISAFDVVLPTPIPYKGQVLTALSLFWFNFLRSVVPNHLITANIDEYPAELIRHRGQLEGRSMIVHRANVFPVECVARGYLTGSGLKDYKAIGKVCGIMLPSGLVEASKLSEPIFTPATKAKTGHDMNISEAQMADIVGADVTNRLKELTLELYCRAEEYARSCGIIIADTKFEFGFRDGNIILVDEVLTPDSSRFWPADQYTPGKSQSSFDKQYVRDYLEALEWNKKPPAPALPSDVVENTSRKYLEAYRLITGQELPLG